MVLSSLAIGSNGTMSELKLPQPQYQPPQGPASQLLTPAEVFSGTHAFATSLLLVSVDTFGPECTSWLPETVAIESSLRFKVDIEDETLSKLRAVWALLQTDGFYQRIPEFVDVCNGLNGYSEAVIPTVAEMAWGVVEASVVYPSPNDEVPFSLDIAQFIRTSSEMQGYQQLPGVLEAAAVAAPIMEDPLSAFADDPEMYGAIKKDQNQDKRLMEIAVWRQLSNLMGQLRRLQLRDREALEEYVSAVSRSLQTP